MASKHQKAHILLNEYKRLYKEKYNKEPVINIYREKWGMQDVIDSLGFDKAQEILNYYFRVTSRDHSLQFFYNNFDRMVESKEKHDADRAHRAHILEMTKQLMREKNESRSRTD